MKALLLILAVASITDLPGCFVCSPDKIGSVVNYKAVTWPVGINVPTELQPWANATCTETGWQIPTLPPYDVSALPPPPAPKVPTNFPSLFPVPGTPQPYVFPTNVPTKPAAP